MQGRPPNQMWEQVTPYLPAFTAYEKGLVEWFGQIPIPRDDSHSLPFRVEYAGGEKAIRAIRALKGDDARNERVRIPVVTIRLQNIEYFVDRYHPPESFVGVYYPDGGREKTRRGARISKPAPYKLTYDIQIYTAFEVDLRYAMGMILQKFHHHGGLSYLVMHHPFGDGIYKRELFPLWLRGYSHNVDIAGDDRQVKGSCVFEMEAYLALPYHFVPTFHRYYETFQMKGTPGETVIVTPPPPTNQALSALDSGFLMMMSEDPLILLEPINP